MFLRWKIVFMFSLFFIAGILSAQEMRKTLFEEVDKLKANAEEVNAQLMAPNNYEEGVENYKDAETGLKDGDDLDDIRELIEKATENFRKAYNKAKLASEALADMIKARSDAEEVGSALASPDEWESGVEYFRNAAEEFEDGDTQDAQSTAKEAENYFRAAELNAIKTNILGETWALLEQADEMSVEDFAPVTLAKAKLLIQQSESELNDARYDNDHAIKLAKESNYEVKHSIYMTRLITEMQEKDKTWEDLILSSEEPLIGIASVTGLKVFFDTGYESPKQKITNYIETNNRKLKASEDSNQSLMAENEELKLKLSALNNELLLVKGARDSLQAIFDEMERVKKEFDSVANLFAMSEAEVLKDGENIVIRLLSLNFEAGKAIINPEYFNILSKISESISKFPNSTVSVEGHTDSQGSDEKNLQLSQDRAEAVRQYLLANLQVDQSKILAIGYGETKPIANNETQDGRKKNRRIDVVINPN